MNRNVLVGVLCGVLGISAAVGAQSYGTDGIVRRHGSLGQYGEATLVQWDRSSVITPTTFTPTGSPVILISGSSAGGDIDLQPPPYSEPENPIVRFLLVKPKVGAVNLVDGDETVASFPADTQGWADIQWTGSGWECVGWGGAARPAMLF